MKTSKVVASFFLGTLLAAAIPAHAKDPCGTVLCLGGSMMGGSGGSMCKSAIDDYFDIRKYKHGDFSPSRTPRARASWLNGCDSPDNKVTKDRINAKYGTVYSNPGF